MTTTHLTTWVSTEMDVEAPIDRCFEVFTAGIGTWWDQDKHILEGPLAVMVFEPRVGGNIVDIGTDGSECRWARVLAYDPPDRVCFSWDINLNWQLETDPAKTSEVEITFTAKAPDRTHVVLTHRHLDRHGDGWEKMRDAVGAGWSLAGFARAAQSSGASEMLFGRALPVVSDETMRARLAGAAAYSAVLLFRTPAFVRPAVDPVIWEHGRRNMALVEAGWLSVVLPGSDDSALSGIGIFALGAEDAKTVMEADPGVRAGIFTFEIHPVRGFPGAALP